MQENKELSKQLGVNIILKTNDDIKKIIPSIIGQNRLQAVDKINISRWTINYIWLTK